MRLYASLPEDPSRLVGRVIALTSENRARSAALISSWLEAQSARGLRAGLLDCDFDEFGVWAGLRQLFEDLAPQMMRSAPDLVAAHDYELVMISPTLRRIITPRHLNLTDLALRRRGSGSTPPTAPYGSFTAWSI